MARSSKKLNKQHKSKPRETLTPEFKKWLKKFNNNHFDVLKESAKR